MVIGLGHVLTEVKTNPDSLEAQAARECQQDTSGEAENPEPAQVEKCHPLLTAHPPENARRDALCV